MQRVNTFLSFLLVLFLFLIVQESGVVQFGGIRANLLLVGFIVLVTLRFPLPEIAALLLALAAYVLFNVPLALSGFAVFSAVVLLSRFMRRFLTGRFLVDFLLLLLFSTAALYYALPLSTHMLSAGLSFSGVAFPSARILFVEIALNAAAAAVLLLTGSRTKVASSFR